MPERFLTRLAVASVAVALCFGLSFAPLHAMDGRSDTGSVVRDRARGAISGTVSDDDGPVAGAVVKIQGSSETVVTDDSGAFRITGVKKGKPLKVAAWKHAYYCSVVKEVKAPADRLRFKLVRYQTNDNPRYEWIPPVGSSGGRPAEKTGCAKCHAPAFIGMCLDDAHMQSAQNPRFLSMFYGTDTKGNKGQPTRYVADKFNWSNIAIPQAPDPQQPHYGPGFLLDSPGAAKTCTACHIPGASMAGDVDPQRLKGADRFGIHCDFCHKVADVNLNAATKMPFPLLPGVLGMDVRRPDTGDKVRRQLFFGTFGDVDLPDTALPLLKESRYCAPCHSGAFWDTVVYDSYGEWLRSPYSDPKSGKAKTCQECHMPSPVLIGGKAMANIAPGKGGISRPPAAIHNHNMTVDARLLRDALTMTVAAREENGRITVRVRLLNDKTGHHVPSDSPLRHLILLVEARDGKGAALKQLDGPILPPWCGTEAQGKGHYAGLPGKTYAKLLKEKWTGIFPTAAYWRHTDKVSDNRLAAFAVDETEFSFARNKGEKATVSVKLLYRRAFIALMEQKRWNAPDIVMAEKKITLKEDRSAKDRR